SEWPYRSTLPPFPSSEHRSLPSLKSSPHPSFRRGPLSGDLDQNIGAHRGSPHSKPSSNNSATAKTAMEELTKTAMEELTRTAIEEVGWAEKEAEEVMTMASSDDIPNSDEGTNSQGSENHNHTQQTTRTMRTTTHGSDSISGHPGEPNEELTPFSNEIMAFRMPSNFTLPNTESV
ncbi:hypothetical protein PIB30_099306, partial [Stylosanthes scabra]|nr:hypothetical protein [Stylosanthes scabra]